MDRSGDDTRSRPAYPTIRRKAALIGEGQGGVADATSIRVKFSYDPVEGRLRYELAPEAARSGRPLGRLEDEILYATIHRGATAETGLALFTLRSAGTSAPMRALQLSRRDQSDLMQGRVYLLVATRGNPAGARAQLKLP